MNSLINESTFAVIEDLVDHEMSCIFNCIRRNPHDRQTILRFVTHIAQFIEKDITQIVEETKRQLEDRPDVKLSIDEQMTLRRIIGTLMSIVTLLLYKTVRNIDEAKESFCQTMILSDIMEQYMGPPKIEGPPSTLLLTHSPPTRSRSASL